MQYYLEKFPQLQHVSDPALTGAACGVWNRFLRENQWKTADEVPFTLDPARGSLVDHTRATLQCAWQIAQDMMRVYPIRLHTDWVLLGAFLHDVSKIAEYRQDEPGAYVRTAAGALYQHAFLGAHYALQAGLPPEVVSIIQCHTPQSNVKMKLLEGVIVQHAEAGIAASGIDYAGQMREALH